MLDSSVQRGRAESGASGFTVSVHPDRRRIVVAPAGDIDLVTVSAVARELDDVCAAGFEDIVVDLRAVTFIDSSGLHLLLAETRRAQRDGHRFRLLGASPAARQLFAVTGTADTFEFADPPRG